MSDHYCCKRCNQIYSACSCLAGFDRKGAGRLLKEEADQLEIHHQKEEGARYWLSVRAQAQKLCEEAIKECRTVNKNRQRHLSFGEIFDENVAKKLAECLIEEEFQIKLKYHEGNTSAYLHDDRASYWWVDVSW